MVYEWVDKSTGKPGSLSVKEGSFSLALHNTYSFDGEGRLLTAHVGDVFYKRGYSGRILEKRRTVSGERFYRHIDDEAESDNLLNDIGKSIGQALNSLPDTIRTEVRSGMQKLTQWSVDRYRIDRQRFNQTYRRVGILPPDQYMAVVLQATEGCHYNRCTFCTFYHGSPFHIKSRYEYLDHVQQVLAYYGMGISIHPTLFLADANAMVIPHQKLVELLHITRTFFEIAPRGLRGKELMQWRRSRPGRVSGIYSFIDALTGRRKKPSDFEELAELGLRRIYIGMESGHEPLLKYLAKPSMPGDVTRLVASARSAGIEVAVIVMVGIGGRAYARGHIDDSIRLIEQLHLGEGDLVFLSEYVPEPGSVYDAKTRIDGIAPLSASELSEQAALLRSRIDPSSGVRVADYNIREFIY